MDDVELSLRADGVAADRSALRPAFDATVERVLGAATIPLPVYPRAVVGGRVGHHTEHLGHLLAVMQHLPRTLSRRGLVSVDPVAPPSLAAVMAVLETVLDPEVPVVSVVDLGIVRGVRPADDVKPAAVLLTPTYTGCPATVAIEQAVRLALDAAGFDGLRIETVLAPPWTTDWITDRGRRQLKDYGIAPPPKGAARVHAQGRECGRVSPLRLHRDAGGQPVRLDPVQGALAMPGTALSRSTASSAIEESRCPSTSTR